MPTFVLSATLRRAAFAALGLLLASCAGNGSSGFATVAVSRPAASIVSPYVRTLDDGTTLHIYPPPSQRWAPNFPDHVEYHGGPIVRRSVTYAIFWRPKGTFMDAKYEPVIEAFMHDVGDTTQYNVLTQYYDKRYGILNASDFGGAWTDTSRYPDDFNHGGTGDRDLHAEVLKAVAINHWPKGGVTAIFTIFTASRAPDDRWAACAYHGSFRAGNAPYIYAIVPYQHDYGPQGCGTPTDKWPNDRDADQTIDTYWHEQAEATSDPLDERGAWYSDRSGAEIADLCESSYGRIRPDGADTLLHGRPFVTQKIWSNFDYHCVQHQRM